MSCVAAKRRLGFGLVGITAVLAMLVTTLDEADARAKRKRHGKRYHKAQSYHPPSASIVVDVKTGATLQQSSADALRHPASLTKVMTLYLLFERLEAGKLKLNSALDVSAHASRQPPTKLGVKPGQTLVVEDAIKALVTKSANDAAVVVAEALGGTEEEFARQMTRKARTLGMTHTVYQNASGLPDPDQVTTARDQAVLGIAVQERFPRYYRYFATSSFAYGGKAMRNHNKLLGKVEGVDGIKTGYTHASGFNLLTSMRRGDRHVVAVVLGGSSGGARDARMRSLLASHIMEASVKRTAPTRFAAADPAEVAVPAPTPVAAAPAAAPAPAAPAKHTLAAAGSVPVALEATAAIPTPKPGSTDPIKPLAVKTVMVKVAPAKTAPAKPVQTAALDTPAPAAPVAAMPVPQAPMPAVAMPTVQHPAEVASLPPPSPPPGARPGVLGVLPASIANKPVPVPVAAPDRPIPRKGWAIQIGAYPEESEAKQKLSAAAAKAAKLLGKADSYTERTSKGGKTFYRARFVVADGDKAEAVCKQLKRSEISCMTLKL